MYVRACASVPTLFWISNYYNNRRTEAKEFSGPFGECRRNAERITRKAGEQGAAAVDSFGTERKKRISPEHSGPAGLHRVPQTPPIIAVISSGHGDYKQ